MIRPLHSDYKYFVPP